MYRPVRDGKERTWAKGWRGSSAPVSGACSMCCWRRC